MSAHADKHPTNLSGMTKLKSAAETLPSSVTRASISAQMKAGLDELKEKRMPSEAIRLQEPRRLSVSLVVMVAVLITSFCRQKPRGKSDWL